MKYFFVALSVLYCSCVLAQDTVHYTDNNIMLHAETSIINFHAWKLNDVYIAGNGRPFPAIRSIGLGVLVSEDQDRFRYEWNCAFHYYIPQGNDAFLNGQDTRTRLHGWEFLSCKDGIDIIPAKLFDLSGGLGFYCGNLKLDFGSKRYTNPFVAPMAKIDLRMNIWRISLGARASGRYDLTYGNWKRKSSGMMELPEYKFREMQCTFYIGWIFQSQ